jgi:hypothetical protein
VLGLGNVGPLASKPVMEGKAVLFKHCAGIDAIDIDNRTIRDLTIRYPGVYFLCLSEDRFHPELREALCYHIYACINKPVDPSEIYFWLRSIFCDNPV